MISSRVLNVRGVILVGCAAAIVGFPTLIRAQGAATQPPPAPAAAQGAATALKPVAPPMSDSLRTAARAEVTRQLKMMADSLKLTKEQRDKARPILLDAAYQMREMRMKYSAMERTPANRDAMMGEMKTMREATDAKLAAVLSPDQMTQYKQMRDAALAKARTRMGMAAPAADTTKK
jgi:hypothetical protein